MLKYLLNLGQTILNSSLNVVLATCLCSMAFYKLPLGNTPINYSAILILGAATWAIYIFDRLLDNAKDEKNQTKRHVFHKEYQFNLSLLLISLLTVAAVLAFFLPYSVKVFGGVILISVACYFYIIKHGGQFYKEILMPIIYILAVVGVPFVEKTSLNFSSWILAGIFFLVTVQNMLCFSVFESLGHPETVNINQKIKIKAIRKIINAISGLVIFITLFFFLDFNQYSNRLAFSLLLISVLNSLLVVYSQTFITNERYRWVLDSFLFLIVLSF